MCVFRALQKSTSIPVHLSVSRTNEVGLPPGLRPKHNFTSTASNGGHQTGIENVFFLLCSIQFSRFHFGFLKLDSQKTEHFIQMKYLKGNPNSKFLLNQKGGILHFFLFLNGIFWHFVCLCFDFFVNCREQVVFGNTNFKILPKELEHASHLV